MKHGLLILTLLLCLTAPARADFWTLEGGFDYETAELGVLWWPDPNGGIGAALVTDSMIPEPTEDNIAIGPVVEFSLKALYDTIWDTILPGNWAPSDVIPGEPFGKLGLLWQTGGSHDMIFLAGTGWKFIRNGVVQPTVWGEIFRPEGSSILDTNVRVLVGVTVQLGK